jgi:hypothetical protein
MKGGRFRGKVTGRDRVRDRGMYEWKDRGRD